MGVVDGGILGGVGTWGKGARESEPQRLKPVFLCAYGTAEAVPFPSLWIGSIIYASGRCGRES